MSEGVGLNEIETSGFDLILTLQSFSTRFVRYSLSPVKGPLMGGHGRLRLGVSLDRCNSIYFYAIGEENLISQVKEAF